MGVAAKMLFIALSALWYADHWHNTSVSTLIEKCQMFLSWESKPQHLGYLDLYGNDENFCYGKRTAVVRQQNTKIETWMVLVKKIPFHLFDEKNTHFSSSNKRILIFLLPIFIK